MAANPHDIERDRIKNLLRQHLQTEEERQLQARLVGLALTAEQQAAIALTVEEDLRKIFLGRELWLQQEREKFSSLMKRPLLPAEETDLQNRANQKLINPADNNAQNLMGTQELRNFQAKPVANVTTASTPQTGFMAFISGFFTMIVQMFTGLQKMLNPEKTPLEHLQAGDIEQAHTLLCVEEQELLAKLDALQADITPGSAAAGVRVARKITAYRTHIATLEADNIWENASPVYKRANLVDRIKIFNQISRIAKNLEEAHKPITAVKDSIVKLQLEEARLRGEGAVVPANDAILVAVQNEIRAKNQSIGVVEGPAQLDMEEAAARRAELNEFNPIIRAFEVQVARKNAERQAVKIAAQAQAQLAFNQATEEHNAFNVAPQGGFNPAWQAEQVKATAALARANAALARANAALAA